MPSSALTRDITLASTRLTALHLFEWDSSSFVWRTSLRWTRPDPQKWTYHLPDLRIIEPLWCLRDLMRESYRVRIEYERGKRASG